MASSETDKTTIVTLVGALRDKSSASVLIDSIRSFGGPLSCAPIWLFEADPAKAPCGDIADTNVKVFPLNIPEKT